MIGFGPNCKNTIYTMEDKLEELVSALKGGTVVFEYVKKDGSVRTATGTLDETLMPEREPDEFELDMRAVDTLVGIKYKDMDEYAELNKIEFLGESEDGLKYRFRHKHRTVGKNPALLTYYDLEKGEFRSFDKANFKQIVTVCSRQSS